MNLGPGNKNLSSSGYRSKSHGVQRTLPGDLCRFRILEQGGNATDAGVAAGIAINVTLPQWTGFGGVAPIIIHDAASGETRSISGLGRWPKSASIDYFCAQLR